MQKNCFECLVPKILYLLHLDMSYNSFAPNPQDIVWKNEKVILLFVHMTFLRSEHNNSSN